MTERIVAGQRLPRVDRPARAAFACVATLLAVAALAGSSNDGGVTADGATVVTVATVVTMAAGGGPPTSVVPATDAAETTQVAVTVPIDAPVLLQQALAAVAGGYHFRTAVTLDGIEVLVAAGDRVGDGTRLTIWTSGTSLSYVITPAGSWVVPDGGQWQPLDSAPATTDPLLALRAPSAVTGTSPDGVAATLVATVPATALGVPSAGTADVRIVTNGATLQEVRYEALLDGRTAEVSTIFGPVVDPTPVTPPI